MLRYLSEKKTEITNVTIRDLGAPKLVNKFTLSDLLSSTTP